MSTLFSLFRLGALSFRFKTCPFPPCDILSSLSNYPKTMSTYLNLISYSFVLPSPPPHHIFLFGTWTPEIAVFRYKTNRGRCVRHSKPRRPNRTISPVPVLRFTLLLSVKAIFPLFQTTSSIDYETKVKLKYLKMVHINLTRLADECELKMTMKEVEQIEKRHARLDRVSFGTWAFDKISFQSTESILLMTPIFSLISFVFALALLAAVIYALLGRKIPSRKYRWASSLEILGTFIFFQHNSLADSSRHLLLCPDRRRFSIRQLLFW